MNTVRNPQLRQASEAILSVISGALSGSIDRQDGKLVVSAANAAARIEAEDLKGRLAAPKLAAIEAKLVENSKTKMPGRIERERAA